jgi:hypothetical protein
MLFIISCVSAVNTHSKLAVLTLNSLKYLNAILELTNIAEELNSSIVLFNLSQTSLMSFIELHIRFIKSCSTVAGVDWKSFKLVGAIISKLSLSETSQLISVT